MSQDDQRNQPNEESAEAGRTPGTAAGPAGGGAVGPTGDRPAERSGAGAGVAGATGVGPARPVEPAGVGAAGSPEPPRIGPVGTEPTITGTTGTTGTGDAAGTTGATGTTGTTTGTARPTTASRHLAEPRREFHEPGEGAPRYADTPADVPRSGSEQSWSAAPNPGYQRDPAINYPAKRVVVTTLVGALVMAALISYGARILTNRSNNGDGSAPWTAAVEKDGAVVNGISAQGNGSPHEIPQQVDLNSGNTGATTSGAFTAAIASCRTASAITIPVTTETGTPAAIGGWAAQATLTVQSLRNDAAALASALNLGHVSAVASAANKLCSAVPTVAALPPLPDAQGSQAWSSAVTSYTTGATQALQAASGNPDSKGAAFDGLNQGDKQLDALSARINGAATA